MSELPTHINILRRSIRRKLDDAKHLPQLAHLDHVIYRTQDAGTFNALKIMLRTHGRFADMHAPDGQPVTVVHLKEAIYTDGTPEVSLSRIVLPYPPESGKKARPGARELVCATPEPFEPVTLNDGLHVLHGKSYLSAKQTMAA